MEKQANEKEVFLEHTFNAGRERVFNAWIDPEQLAKWYAPDDCTVYIKNIDAVVGGGFHMCIRNPQFGDCWSVGTYREIVPYSKIVFTLVNADEDGNPIDPATIGMDPDWPGQTLVTVTFEDLNGKTRMQLRQTVSEAIAKRTGAYPSWLQMLNKLQTLIS